MLKKMRWGFQVMGKVYEKGPLKGKSHKKITPNEYYKINQGI